MTNESIVHPFEPVYNENSTILILGSFPSVISRENNFYYGNKNNRFWTVVSAIFNCSLPKTIDEKTKLILENNLALYDVINTCTISGSADSSIKNVVPNNINLIVENSNISKIILNGKTAYNLYNKYIFEALKIAGCCLPSTSSANAKWRLNDLIDVWSKALKKTT
ncbi:MAG: DNA-deoxyinosine glycosylase [Christensenellaceae bacterium]|nr:DNA-deoxyinosine glycosylase [Christensenellaceae bacterium]